MFVVTLLLSKVVSWFRAQPGTSDLRALIYMDEVFGFAPPTAEPPSKKPILTILKQARAHGVGMILSTQNPVDLDYKAMSNAGTWMVGRLQTENDKKRILEGIASATGAVDVGTYDKLISDLEKRQFLMSMAKASEPTLFGTRWAMSYLAGPMTRDQVVGLDEGKGGRGGPQCRAGPRRPLTAGPATSVAAPRTEPVATADTIGHEEVPVMPTVAEGVATVYLDPAAAWAGEVGADPTGDTTDRGRGSNRQPYLRRHQGRREPSRGIRGRRLSPRPGSRARFGQGSRSRREGFPSRSAAGGGICPPGAQDRHQVLLECPRHRPHQSSGRGKEDDRLQERCAEAVLPTRRVTGRLRRKGHDSQPRQR